MILPQQRRKGGRRKQMGSIKQKADAGDLFYGEQILFHLISVKTHN
jgi:hypothetical protein